MSVTIRLMRFGKPKNPFYRIVVLDKRKKRDGAYIERIGIYNPLKSDKNIELSKSRFDYWRQKGAQMSEGFERLLHSKKLVTYQE